MSSVVNLTLIDLPGLTKVAVEGQPKTIVQDIEQMVRSYIEKPQVEVKYFPSEPINALVCDYDGSFIIRGDVSGDIYIFIYGRSLLADCSRNGTLTIRVVSCLVYVDQTTLIYGAEDCFDNWGHHQHIMDMQLRKEAPT